MHENARRVLLIPPDHSRFYSDAGTITNILYDLLSPTAKVDILPALGTHNPMTNEQITMMFGDQIPKECFIVHDWKNGLQYLGDVPGEKISEWSDGKVDYSVRVEVNKLLFDDYDLILSIGQIVPHEVVGMANYSKNICVGVGGQDTINKSHFLGAVYGIERLLGQSESAVRNVFNYGCQEFMSHLPIYYFLTVMEKDSASENMYMRGLYIGDDDETFELGCKLSQEVNIICEDKPQKKIVAYLPPHEFASTWLGNKAIYRTRMLMADDGELIILAPGLKEFGEDKEIDALIRKYGYRTTDITLKQVNDNDDIANNLSAAAHLIHGTSEGRFKITYCPGPGISREEIESVGYQYGKLDEMLDCYPIDQLKDGYNTLPDGEEIYYISNPALGLWAYKGLFDTR